jgi:hypothetical protein
MRSFFTNLDSEEDNQVVKDDGRLNSCKESIGDLLADIISESELNKMIIEFNYNAEAVIDAVLNLPKEGLYCYFFSNLVSFIYLKINNSFRFKKPKTIR